MNTVTLFVNEILDIIKKTPDKAKKIELLKQNDCQALRQIMYANFAENIKFRLPPGKTPYKPLDVPVGMAATNLYKMARQIYLFIENSSAKLTQMKVESLWVNMLENVQKDEAIVLESMRNKAFEKDYDLSRDVVEAAYFGLLPAAPASVSPAKSAPSQPQVKEAPSKMDDAAAAKAEAKRLKRNEYARKYAARDRAATKAAKEATLDVNKSGE